MKTVYIASPYTLGDVAVNVKKQMDTASALIDMGVAPYWPVHSHFLHMVYPKSYEKWMEQCFHWLEKSDCVLRLPGESKGADREVQRAKELCIPVFYTLNEVFEYFVYLDYKEEQKRNSSDQDLPF